MFARSSKVLLSAMTLALALGATAGSAAAGERLATGLVVEVQDGWDRDSGWRGERGRWDGDRPGRGWGEERRWHDRGPDAYERGDIIPERRIVRRLMRSGFVEVVDVDLRGDRYVVRAVRPNGAVIRLAIDAYDGDVIDQRRVGWSRDRGGPGRGWQRGGVEFQLGNGVIGLYER